MVQKSQITLYFIAAVISASIRLEAADVSFVGADITTNDAWRTTSIIKSLDADGDDLYGTDGYLLIRSPDGDLFSNPSYGTVSRLAPSVYYGGATNYTKVDNPLGGADVATGTWYRSDSGNIAQIDISQSVSFRLGILIDMHDFTGISPNRLSVDQTAGGSASSSLQNSQLDPDLDADWYFFDIIDAQAGDTFVVYAENNAGHGSNGIGGLTFDTIVPEPSFSALFIGCFSGLGLVYYRQKRKRGFASEKSSV